MKLSAFVVVVGVLLATVAYSQDTVTVDPGFDTVSPVDTTPVDLGGTGSNPSDPTFATPTPTPTPDDGLDDTIADDPGNPDGGDNGSSVPVDDGSTTPVDPPAAGSCACEQVTETCDVVTPDGPTTCIGESVPCTKCICAFGGALTCTTASGASYQFTGPGGAECEATTSTYAVCP
eukprot:CAMPEP_0185851146 /NCGR_PEP_ID=MMETSP1354-20130828/6242_1 /TAXON_ID=708628 /ORGANISM="Erythrolobus madagascarensis, Strain CCMP3276" /LENGTH=175 /DNA_ID=CAMNT_0028552013 /DNA_START=42 /DNA_END=569 /DNA_ORIENTATION=-